MTASASTIHAADLGRLWRLTRKELSESLRDRRTLGTLVLMPVLLYPLLAMAFLQLQQSSRVENVSSHYRLGFDSREDAVSLHDFWEGGRKHVIERHAPSRKGNDERSLPAYLSPMPELDAFIFDDLDEAVRSGRVDVGIRLRPKGGTLAHPRRQRSTRVRRPRDAP